MDFKRSGNILGSIVIFFIILFTYTKIAGPIEFSVNNINSTKTDSFQVQGTGKVAAAPDKALINIGITNDGSTVAIAQEKTNQSADKITSALKNLGVSEKDIKTVSYSVNPNFDLSSRKNGTYTVSQTFEVKVPIEKTNQAIDLATANGANIVGNITFVLDDDKQNELENQARAEAVKEAKAKANGLANVAGIKLGKIINVSESFGGSNQIPLMMEAKTSDGSSTPTNILPGQTTVEVTVTLTYDTF